MADCGVFLLSRLLSTVLVDNFLVVIHFVCLLAFRAPLIFKSVLSVNHALACNSTMLSVASIFLFDVENVVVRQRIRSLFIFSTVSFAGYVGLAK